MLKLTLDLKQMVSKYTSIIIVCTCFFSADCGYQTLVICSEKIVYGLSQDSRAMATALLAKGFISDKTLVEINEAINLKVKVSTKVSWELLSSILTDIKISRTYTSTE